MFRLIRKWFWWLLLLGILTIFFFLSYASFTSETIIAAVSQIEAAPGEILYRSEQKLTDESGNTWQVILLKRVYPGQVQSVNLRLMGCPGAGELVHPQPLRIATATGKVWIASDVFVEEAPAPTIGQYNLKDILSQLPTEPLQLSLPLGRERFINISVPQNVVREWQQVAVKQVKSQEYRLD